MSHGTSCGFFLERKPHTRIYLASTYGKLRFSPWGMLFGAHRGNRTAAGLSVRIQLSLKPRDPRIRLGIGDTNSYPIGTLECQ